MRKSFFPDEFHHEQSIMASTTNHNNPTGSGRTNWRRWRKRKKRTRTVGTQTCASLATNWYTVLDPNAPSECEGVVRLDYYPNDDETGNDDYWEENEWEYEEEYIWDED